MKKINASMILIMVSLITFFAISCKKEDKPKNKLDDAKTWYTKSTEKTKLFIKSNNSEIKGIKQEVLWTEAHISMLDDGTEIIGVPLNIKFPNGAAANGSFMLFISNNNGIYKSFTVYNKKENYFDGSDIDAKIQTSYNNGSIKIANASKQLQTNQGKKSNIEQPPTQCMEWFLVTTYYDEYGMISYTEETYLFTTCEGTEQPGAGGGTGGLQPEFSLDFGSPTSIGETSVALMENDTVRTKRSTWIFHEGPTYRFKSTEILTQVKMASGGGWQYAGISHVDHYVTGSFIGGAVAISGFNWSPTNYLNEINAYVDYRANITLTLWGVTNTYSGDEETSSHRWGTSW